MKLLQNLKNRNGFSLVELILYISMTALLLLIISTVLFIIWETRIKNEVMNDVDSQGALVMEMMSSSIRNSGGINSPTIGNTASQVSLIYSDSLKNPTLYSVVNGVLMKKEGTGVSTAITNSKVTVSNITFLNVGRPNTPGAIKIVLTLSGSSSAFRKEYVYSRTFYVSATVR